MTNFWYRLHLPGDTKYELPMLSRVTKASVGEPTVAKELIQNYFPAWLKLVIQTITAERGYDSCPRGGLKTLKKTSPLFP